MGLTYGLHRPTQVLDVLPGTAVFLSHSMHAPTQPCDARQAGGRHNTLPQARRPLAAEHESRGAAIPTTCYLTKNKSRGAKGNGGGKRKGRATQLETTMNTPQSLFYNFLSIPSPKQEALSTLGVVKCSFSSLTPRQ